MKPIAEPLTLKPIVPEALLKSCDDLPELEGDTLGAMVQNHIESARRFYECKDRHEKLSEAVRTWTQGPRGGSGSKPGTPGI
ncbi:hypothetical protein [Roseomonas marmotae]|uniref:hypothetical protein n=1 Tax=Roseomonas marmotae TaxID=2768161 RepID=UPI003AF57F49